MATTTSKLVLPRRNFTKDESGKSFAKKAIIGSFLVHLFLLFLKFPEAEKVLVKEKLSSIKMNYIKPSESYLKKKETFTKEQVAKVLTNAEAGAKVVTSTATGVSGDPTQSKTQTVQKSKAGSAKNGPRSTPGAAGATTLGDSSNKSYEFKGKGLKALMGNSATMTLAAGAGNEGSHGATGGKGLANKGNNLTGDYRAPASIGDGTGLGGKDAVGNYDRSTTTKGLANKKGIDTAFVQADTVVLGSIDPEILRKILGEYLAQFKFCYQQELQEQSEKIKGIVDLNFRIEGDGKVSKVNIKSAQTKFSDRGISCMSNILKMIDFPKPKGGGLVDVRQPLNFFSESTKI